LRKPADSNELLDDSPDPAPGLSGNRSGSTASQLSGKWSVARDPTAVAMRRAASKLGQITGSCWSGTEHCPRRLSPRGCFLEEWLGCGRVRIIISWHFFFLGAGFLLLEMKAVTPRSLLFDSTWIVNAVVISAFLLMALVANAVIACFNFPRGFSYGLLLFLLVADFWFPYSLLNPEFLPQPPNKLIPRISAGWASLPRLAEKMAPEKIKKKTGRAIHPPLCRGGTPILGNFAISLYLISTVVLRRAESEPTSS
jgi:hypothetical protein